MSSEREEQPKNGPRPATEFRLRATMAQEAAVGTAAQKVAEILRDGLFGRVIGMSDLLRRALPPDDIGLSLLGAAVGVHPDTLGRLRDGELAVSDLQSDAAVSLARALRLDYPTFLRLLENEAFSSRDEGVRLVAERQRDPKREAIARETKEAWDFADSIDPTNLGEKPAK